MHEIFPGLLCPIKQIPVNFLQVRVSPHFVKNQESIYNRYHFMAIHKM